MNTRLVALTLLTLIAPPAAFAEVVEACCGSCTDPACADPAAPAAVSTGLAAPAAADGAAVTGAAEAVPAAPVGHPLRGIVVDIVGEKQALLVKHQEIPGVMKAMTMLLKVEPAVLTTVTKGQHITATLVKKDDGWWLLEVKPVHFDG